jgi:DNA-binding response OmpR family regulator
VSPAGARILVVEDDRGIATMLERGLRLAGHRVTVAGGVGEARTAWVAERFDLILLDVMLPDGDGLELLAERRGADDDVPAVLLTAREEAELHDRADRAGATAYLPKPFAWADLLALIERVMRP